ncbi:MAG TPA: 2-C-methyl-D-erythritol 2,4-cyclodiphosphate synthase, partial [bacterium]
MEIEIVPYRIGTGYDVHKLVENRKLVLGGETIPFEKGLIGHSDADVLTHAIMDALLGAMAQGSIGDHFPDTDKKYKNINSIDLLERVRIIMEEEGYIVSNVDSTVICDRPKLAPYIENMRMNLSH